MGGINWTKEQEQVITLRERNLLVSAAAGSGKTATLVERILTYLCRKEHPGEIDHLLVLTFTKAAAAEMRERIGKAIEERLEKDPENVHLQRQSALVHNAQITTIHSFCLYVVRNYFHLLSIDPGFRMGDEGELKLLKKDVLEELLEEYYQEGRAEFHAFVEAYATGKRDEGLGNLILDLAEFSLGYPYPRRWLRECREAYLPLGEEEAQEGKNPQAEEEEAKGIRDGKNPPWLMILLEITRHTLESVREQLRDGISLCLSPQGPYLYEETLQKDLLLVEELLSCASYEEYYEAFQGLSYARLTTKRMGEDVSGEKKEQVKDVRERMKKSFKELKEKYFARSFSGAMEYMEKAAPATCMLLELTERFLEDFGEKKRSRNLVDFSDLEHLALEILVQDVTADEKGKPVVIPTGAAEELADYFEELMIDEYQDSNMLQEVLLTSVSRGRRGTPNVFMVGDVKQSIYSFRLARPELFLEKYETYSTEEGLYQRIDLHQNFRSRKEVLDGANCIFRKIMTAAVGGISYDADAALYLGADYPEADSTETEGGPNQTEILLLETDSLEGEEDVQTAPGYGKESGTGKETEPGRDIRTVRELEAAMVGNRIRELLGEMQVWDGKKGEYRPLGYGDIVILLRSLTGWGDVFARVLTEQGIPAYTESRTGYFDTVEIRTLLNLLRVVDNPRQDIPLAAVMKSMIGGFADEELACIRSAYREQRFSEACIKYREEQEGELACRLGAFYDRIKGYRYKAQYLSIHELITYVLEDSGYGDYLAVMPGGEQRSANMRMLVERAIVFESTSYRGLFHFVRYMEQLQNYQEDLGEASISGENAQAVRIMSIHKSKGLEFPVVFVGGLGKGFNYQDSRSRVALHPELGVGVDYVDSKRRVKTPTLPKKVIQKKRELEMLGEELRILYVALTRAQEKLILTGAAGGLEKRLEACKMRAGRETLDYLELTKARTCWDWLLPAVYGEEQFLIRRIGPEELVLPELETQMEEAGKRSVLEALLQKADGQDAYQETGYEPEGYLSQAGERLARRLGFSYPFLAEVELQPKVSVSELKRGGQVEEEDREMLLYREPEVVPYVPRFVQEGTPLSGAARGTAYHRVLQELPFDKMTHTDRVKEALKAMEEQGKLTPQMAKSVYPFDIFAFCQSSLAKRMTRARKEGLLYMEQPFVISQSAKEIRPEWDSEEPVLIQGIIDAWFYEEGEIVILDYKTDWVKEGRELVERYGKQLNYYGTALEQITGRRVKEKVIYSFCLREALSF